MRTTTEIAGRDIPIEPGELITIRFSGGRAGKSEAGAWEFWTVFNDDKGFAGRCLQARDPRERFRRMEGVRGYEDPWKVAASAKGIRPSTNQEVIDWLNGHKEDARFADSCQVGGKTINVVKTVDGFQFK
jgi:hypothetical protein